MNTSAGITRPEPKGLSAFLVLAFTPRLVVGAAEDAAGVHFDRQAFGPYDAPIHG
jgi:hypothetical protein